MPRHKESIVRNYFNYIVHQNKSVCAIGDCKRELQGSHASNLEKHVQRSHPEVYAVYMARKETYKFCKKNGTTLEIDPPCKTLKNQKSFFANEIIETAHSSQKSPVLCVNLSKDDIVNACVKLVTINGRPFSLMNDEGFKDLLNPILSALPRSQSVSINESSIKCMIQDRASCLKDDIRDKTSGTLLSLKIDCTTVLERSFITTNISLYANGQVAFYTLAPVEVTGYGYTDIKGALVNSFPLYGIRTDNICSVVLGNGSKFIKSTYLMNEHEEKPFLFGVGDEDGAYNEENDICRIDTLFDDEQRCVNTNDNLLDTVRTILEEEGNCTETSIPIMNCGLMEFQQAICDTFKFEDEENEVLKTVRLVIKSLKSQYTEDNDRHKELILDSPSNWLSTYNMLKKFLELKRKQLKVSTKHWTQMDEMKKCLEACKKAVRSIMTEKIVVPDLYRIWYTCILDLTKLGSETANLLSQNLEQRLKDLFNQPVLLSSVYLDPRFNFSLTGEQKRTALNYLSLLSNKIGQLKERVNSFGNTKSPATQDELQMMLIEKVRENQMKLLVENQTNVGHMLECNIVTVRDDPVSIDTILEQFLQEPAIHTKYSIVKFWEEKKFAYPELYPLVCALFSVPVTQISLERAFSQLKYVFKPPQPNMSRDLVDDVVFLKANYDFSINLKI